MVCRMREHVCPNVIRGGLKCMEKVKSMVDLGRIFEPSSSVMNFVFGAIGGLFQGTCKDEQTQCVGIVGAATTCTHMEAVCNELQVDPVKVCLCQIILQCIHMCSIEKLIKGQGCISQS